MSSTTAPDPVVVGIDIGGTSVKGAIAGRDGLLLGRERRPTQVGDAAETVVDTVVEIFESLKERVGENSVAVGVGVVMPGVVDRANGVARYSANIGWHDLPIRRLVAERVGIPVTIDHDVRAATCAEMRQGAAVGVQDVLFVSIGTGLAVGSVVGGKIVEGAAGLAGEAGHLPVFPDGEQCACGQRGCAEAYSSGAAVTRRYAAQTGEDPVPAEEVIARVERGDRPAATVVQEAVVALSRMVLGCVLINDPAVIVLGGGMSAAGNVLIDPLMRALHAGMLWRSPPPVTVSAFGADAGMRGALLLAWSDRDVAG